ncbi:MAG TPA: redoxin domain-containing protein [Clostridia bacterium]
MKSKFANIIIWVSALVLILLCVYVVKSHTPIKESQSSDMASTAAQDKKEITSSVSSTSIHLEATTSPEPTTDNPTHEPNTASPVPSSPKPFETHLPTYKPSPKPVISVMPSKAPVSSSPYNGIDFTLTDLNGKKVSLSDYKGKNVFLNFWATWCPPCRGEMPDIEDVYNESLKNKDFIILAVNLGEDKDTVKAFIDSKGYHFKVLLDLDQKAGDSYGINAIPSSFFIDRNGNIQNKRVGAMSKNDIQQYIKQLK